MFCLYNVKERIIYSFLGYFENNFPKKIKKNESFKRRNRAKAKRIGREQCPGNLTAT
jgi:hypothetical protein